MARCASCRREFYNLREGQVCAAICRGIIEVPYRALVGRVQGSVIGCSQSVDAYGGERRTKLPAGSGVRFPGAGLSRA